MKKIVHVLLIIALIYSCNNTEDNETLSSDPIIGKWQLFQDIENGTDISTSCSRQGTLSFSEDGNFEGIYFTEDSGQNTTACISETQNAFWLNKGSNLYTVDGITRKITFKENFTILELPNGSLTSIFKKLN